MPKKGNIPWNKGLTKEDHPSIKSMSKKKKNHPVTKETREKISKNSKGRIPWNKGLTKETDVRVKRQGEKIRGKNNPLFGHFKEKNPAWKPDWNKLSKVQKHNRMRKIIPKPDSCSVCNKERKLELTNLDHKYSLCIKDWIWKCSSCHKKWDYR